MNAMRLYAKDPPESPFVKGGLRGVKTENL